MARTVSPTRSVYDALVGQDAAVDTLRALATSPAHAYLFVGPAGSGVEAAARAFAAVRMCGTEDPSDSTVDRIVRGMHIDVQEFEREGAGIDAETLTEEIVAPANRSGAEGSNKVLVIHGIDLVDPRYFPILLKTIEEPPAGTTIVLTGREVPDHLATIASRSIRVNFVPVPDDLVLAALVAEGVADEKARQITEVAAGDLERARILVNDSTLLARTELFRRIPERLDGSLSTAIELAERILDAIEEAIEPYKLRQADELAALEERVKLSGERGSGRKDLNDRHKRELRRFRTDELRSGLRTLSLVYRDAFAALDPGLAVGDEKYAESVHRIRHFSAGLARNVNEKLHLEHLLMTLPALGKPSAGRGARP